MPTSEVIKLKNVRLSFPRLFKPRSFRKGQVPRYEATFLLDPSDKAHAGMIKAIEFTADEIADEEWPKKLPAKLVRCYGLAEDEKPPLEYDGYEGMYFLRTAAKVNTPPLIADRGRNTLTIDENGAEPSIPYAGCIVNASVTLWTMDNEFGTRINSNLRIVQFVKDGDRFGVTPPDMDEELDDILDDEDDGDDFLDD
jgi:hypothetical protein